MSLLSRDQIRIVLCPHQVGLVRLARGWSSRVTGKCVVTADAATPGEAPWRAPLAALDRALPEFSSRKADVAVVLSNHFARYTLVAHTDQISTADEEQALVRHSFARIHGTATDRWAMRLSRTVGGNGPQLATAVDQDLLDSLRALFPSASLRLRSIQPCLTAAFNQWRRRFKNSAWFAVVEPGRLCLAGFQNDQWHSVNSIKIGDDWFRDLVIHLERGRLLSAIDAADTAARVPVFVFAPGCPEPMPAQAEQHSLELLRPSPASGDAETADAPYAMALVG